MLQNPIWGTCPQWHTVLYAWRQDWSLSTVAPLCYFGADGEGKQLGYVNNGQPVPVDRSKLPVARDKEDLG